MSALLIFGSGYCGSAIAEAAAAAGMAVRCTTRDLAIASDPNRAPFAAAEEAIAAATHVLSTAPPEGAVDPVLARYFDALARAPGLRWVGYLSTTGVYGDRAGAWVNEDTPPAPTSERARRRVAAEEAWDRLSGRCPVDIFRVAGIYGPGRSVLEELRSGRARRVIRPGHCFGRIHRDDIVQAVLAAMAQDRPPGVRILNLSDDEPAEQSAVIEEAARLLNVAVPPAVPYAQAAASMSDMARSFWAENRKVSSRWTQAALGIYWRFPTYREGLRAILETGRLCPDRGETQQHRS